MIEFVPSDRRYKFIKMPDVLSFSFFLTIKKKKKHEVKRMLEAVGCRIFYLRRDKIGSLSLDPALKQGDFRSLTDEEVLKLKHNE